MKYIWYVHLGLLLVVTAHIFCAERPSTQSFFDYYVKNARNNDQYDQQKLTNLFQSYVNINVLRLNDAETKNALRDLKLLGGSRHMNTILRGVKKGLEPSIAYHQERINNERDYFMLGCGLAATALSIAGFALTYKVYEKWHKGSNEEYERIKDDLARRGISIQKSHGFSCGNMVTFIGLRTKNPVMPQDSEYVNSSHERLVELLNYKEQFVMPVEVMLGTLSVCSLRYPYAFLHNFLCPRHKEHYEKFTHIKEIIEEELERQK